MLDGSITICACRVAAQVQEAVATCLPPLIPAIKDEAPVLVQKLLTQLLNSEHYGERRGAAYGLAGLVRGLGILSLKQLDIMNTLTEAVQVLTTFNPFIQALTTLVAKPALCVIRVCRKQVMCYIFVSL